MISKISKIPKLTLLRTPLRKLNIDIIKNVTRYLGRCKTPILMYHSTMKDKSEDVITSQNLHNVNPKSIERQLLVLKENYRVVFVDEIVRRAKKGKSVEGIAAVTFDDGYKSVIEDSLQILEKLKIPATWYLSTKMITEGTFWRDKIRYIINTSRTNEFLQWLSKQNVSIEGLNKDNFYLDSKNPNVVNSVVMEKLTSKFLDKNVDEKAPFKNLYADSKDISKINSDLLKLGNHTHSHYVLSSLKKYEQKKEIYNAKKILESFDSKKSNLLSVPFGGIHTFNKDTVDVCNELEFEGLLTSSAREISSATSRCNFKSNQLPRVVRYMPSNNNPWFLTYN